MPNNNTLKYRVGRVENEVKSLDKKVDKILVNHLPHIHESIVSMRTSMKILTAINISSIIVGVIVNKLF